MPEMTGTTLSDETRKRLMELAEESAAMSSELVQVYGKILIAYCLGEQAATARQRERDAQTVEDWKSLVSLTDFGAIPSKKSMLEVLIYVASCIRDSGKPAEAIRRQT